MPFCLNCGTELDPNDAFCQDCGAKQEAEPTAASDPKSEPMAEQTKQAAEKEPTKTEIDQTQNNQPKHKDPKQENTPKPPPAKPAEEPKPAPASDTEPAPATQAETQQEKQAKPKKAKKKMSWFKKLLIKILIIAILLTAGAGYAFYDFWVNKDKEQSINWDNFANYYLGKAGLIQRTDTEEESDEKSDKDQNKNDDKDDDNENSSTTRPPVSAPIKPAFEYDQRGDIVDAQGQVYLKLYREAPYYYNPADKKIYEVKNDKLSAKNLDVQIYHNPTYKLLLVFPKGWTGLKTNVETITDENDEKIIFIDFRLPTRDSDYEVARGLASMFKLIIVDKDYYDLLRWDDDSAFQGVSFLGKYDKYGFMVGAEGGHPTDLQTRVLELPDIFEQGMSFH
ncbi:MAG TPA: zinc ribbon domain-containing protein [Candidatus Wirthbacteria bacterium]|nr:zinc ribbon domain-containing protein [Candidatus Wirthbacteria bacterium]